MQNTPKVSLPPAGQDLLFQALGRLHQVAGSRAVATPIGGLLIAVSQIVEIVGLDLVGGPPTIRPSFPLEAHGVSYRVLVSLERVALNAEARELGSDTMEQELILECSDEALAWDCYHRAADQEIR